MTLRIAPGFTLPDETVTQSLGILGQRGAGKSTAAVVLAEEMWKAKLPWVTVDPKGDWYGIRSSPDGKRPGLALPVFGGLHGDVPLEAGAGALIADLVVERNLTAVLDVSDFSKGERARFLIDFFDRLYRRHRAEPQPRHVFLEEAHEYIPQQVSSQDRGTQLKEAASRIVLQGRSFGLGSTTASQRSARIHKDVLTQIGTLIAMRTTGPQDRKAIESWVEYHDQSRELVASLAALKSGEAWMWSPEFLGKAERIQFRQRETFDSGATPAVGKAARSPATLADVDLAAIKEQMAETIERAKADDPRELHRRIVELERQLARVETQGTPEPVVEVERVEVPVVLDAEADQIVHLTQLLTDQATRVEVASKAICERLGELQGRQDEHRRQDVPRAGQARGSARPRDVAAREPAQRVDPPARRESSRTAVPRTAAAEGLDRAQRAVLTVLATYGRRTQNQLALQTGYSAKASTIGVALSKLRRAGYVSQGQPVQITEEGVDALGSYEPLPQGADLLDHWRRTLGSNSAERKVLDELVAAYPGERTKDELCDATGYSPTASTIGVAMSKLRKLELADGWRASADFMEAIGG